MSKPLVAVASLGGTISMTPSDAAGGAVPTLDAGQLVASVPGLAEVADISAEALLRLPSGSLDMAHLDQCLAWAAGRVAAGARGVVLSQGTDTIEETSFYLDLQWRRPEPLVITGAMRTPMAAGADGPSNLLAAVQVAADPRSRERGVLVVMNDAIHRARWVAKGDALAVQAFVSPDAGIEGRMAEGQANYFHAPGGRSVVDAPRRGFPRIALIPALLGDDGALAEAALAGGYEGIVIAGFGAGHIPAIFAERIGPIAEKVPVVIATRTGAGRTATRTYGYAGSEVDLVKRGAILAGWLPPLKARLLLGTLLAARTPRAALADAFASWTSSQG